MVFEPQLTFGPGVSIRRDPDAAPPLHRRRRTPPGLHGARPNFTLTAGTRRLGGSWLPSLFVALFAVSCASTPPLKGGRSTAAASALHAPGISGAVALQQPENPAAASSQRIERTVDQEQEFAPLQVAPPPPAIDGTYQAPSFAPRKYTTRTTERIDTTLGAAQKDTSREISAQIASMRPVQWVGIILVTAALSMFWGPIRAITRSSTLQIFTGAAGLALIFLPLIITASPNMFAIAAIAGIAAPLVYHFAHRHGRLQGFVDANKDGIDDRTVPPQTPRPTYDDPFAR